MQKEIDDSIADSAGLTIPESEKVANDELSCDMQSPSSDPNSEPYARVDLSILSATSKILPLVSQSTPPSMRRPRSATQLADCADAINPFDSLPVEDTKIISSSKDLRLTKSMTSSFTPISPINPFDSPPIHDAIEISLQDGENNNNKVVTEFTNANGTLLKTPIATATDASIFESKISIDIEGEGDNDVLPECKRRLDDVFENESDNDYSQYTDINNLSMQQPYSREQEREEVKCQEEVQEMNDNERNTTSTKRSSTNEESIIWHDNTNYREGGDENSNNDEQNILDHKYCYCFMRLLHRMCKSHIHPPCCISNPSHPHLPTCLKGITPRHRRIICRSLIIVFMIITITFTLLDLLILHRYLHVWLDSTLAWLTDHPVGGGLAFIGVFLVGSLCFFPVELLSLGAGYVYIELYGLGGGIFVALLVCYFGCLLGAAVCFARSRYLMRQLIEKFSVKYPIVRAVDRAFETMGFRLFLLLRLSPAMPFNALNYIGGITAISFRNYWWATCAGIAPGLLWTIFIGASFGTVNKRGVDGKEEFDENSVRKGLVLGLGIGLGIMGLIGTGIYARKELTKIIIAEQMERATEEELGEEEMSQHLMNGECEAIPEEEDGISLSFEDLENPQLGDSVNDFSFNSVNTREGVISLPGRQRKLNPPRSWTPEAVASELPILPKIVQRYLSPMISSLESPGSNNNPIISNYEGNAEASPASDGTPPADHGSVRRSRYTSSSLPPIASFSFDSDDDDDAEEGNTGESTSSPSSPSRRHSLQHNSLDNIKVALMSPRIAGEDKHKNNWPRASSAPMDDNILTGLADIDESRVLSDDESPSKEPNASEILMDHVVAKNESGNRRRCNTDPTDREHGNASPAKRKRRQQSPSWTPLKRGFRLRKSQSFESSTGAQTQQQQQKHSRNRAPSPSQQLHNPDPTDQNEEEGGEIARSSSLPFPQQQQQQHNRPRSSSLPFVGAVLSPSGNHLELDIGNNNTGSDDDEDGDGPSREWFWIWA
mmetsp:Transcript_5358/g.12172  ORF Transcript_5358/g.12172 Transcript_5358/m.12172 type:complete len:1003 (+) Transcript_5358:46-3054(+)